jgi:hypothetical protein
LTGSVVRASMMIICYGRPPQNTETESVVLCQGGEF